MHRSRFRAIAVWIAAVGLMASGAAPAFAQEGVVAQQEIGHLGTNRLVFERIDDDLKPKGRGKGIVEYRGGDDPESTWRASFKFSGLRDDKTYTVVIQGRFGESGSAEAEEFSKICSFKAKDSGKGNCFWYFRELMRLDVVRLLRGDEDGFPTLEADRSGDVGSIETEPNRHSPGGEIPERASDAKHDVKHEAKHKSKSRSRK